MNCNFEEFEEAHNGKRRVRCSACGQKTGLIGVPLDRVFSECRVLTVNRTGLGDYLAYYIAWFTGITKADLSRWLGRDCGCGGRQEKLNTWGERLKAWWFAQAPSHDPAKPPDAS